MPVLEAPPPVSTDTAEERSWLRTRAQHWDEMSLEAQVRVLMQANPEDDPEEYVRLLDNLDLPAEDGIPMETNWHRIAMNLLIDSVHALWHDRTDYFAGGNMFIYFSLGQVLRKHYRGPDVFVVKHVDGTRDRDSWIVWKEAGRYPDVIIELASPSTVKTDLTVKKEIYEQTFRTAEYFCYNPGPRQLVGWQLQQQAYQPLEANEHGWLWSDQLQVWIGTWDGEYQRVRAVWPRFYTPDKQLVFTLKELAVQRAETEARRAETEAQRAETEAQRAETEAQRAETEAQRAETEAQRAQRFAAKLRELGIDPESL